MSNQPVTNHNLKSTNISNNLTGNVLPVTNISSPTATTTTGTIVDIAKALQDALNVITTSLTDPTTPVPSGEKSKHIKVNNNMNAETEDLFIKLLQYDGFMLNWSNFISKAYPDSGALPYNGYPGTQLFDDHFQISRINNLYGKVAYEVQTKQYWAQMKVNGSPYEPHKVYAPPIFQFTNFKLVLDKDSLIIEPHKIDDFTTENSTINKVSGYARNFGDTDLNVGLSLQLRLGQKWSNQVTEGNSTTTKITNTFNVGLPFLPGGGLSSSIEASFTKDQSWSETKGEDRTDVQTIDASQIVKPGKKTLLTVYAIDSQGKTAYTVQARLEYDLIVKMIPGCTTAHVVGDSCTAASDKPTDLSVINLLPKMDGGGYYVRHLSGNNKYSTGHGGYVYNGITSFAMLYLGVDTDGTEKIDTNAIEALKFHYNKRGISGAELFNWEDQALKDYADANVFTGDPRESTLENLLNTTYGGEVKGTFIATNSIQSDIIASPTENLGPEDEQYRYNPKLIYP